MSACVICGCARQVTLFKATDRLYRTTQKEFAVVRCADCGLMWLDPQPDPEELRHYYPETYWFAPDQSAASRLEELYRRVVLLDHVQFVERALCHSRARGPLVDVGCGGGLFLGMMRERGFHVVGLDVSPVAAAVAWRRQHVPSVCGMLEPSPLRRRSCAGITMFHVLEHCHDPRSYLSSAYDVLQADGRLIVQVPDAASWQFRLLGRAWTGVDVPRHLFDFRGCDLERLLKSCGFELLRRKHFSLRDNPATLASSVAPGLDPMARRVHRTIESGIVRLGKDLAYFALVLASLPFTMAEALCRVGSTIMIEARRP